MTVDTARERPGATPRRHIEHDLLLAENKRKRVFSASWRFASQHGCPLPLMRRRGEVAPVARSNAACSA